MKKNAEKFSLRRLVARALSLLVVFALVLGGVWLVKNYNSLSFSSVTLQLKKLIGGKKDAKELRFDVYSDNVFAPLGDCVVSVSDAGVQLIAGDDLLDAEAQLLQRPAVDTGGKIAAAWSVGSKGYWIVSEKSLIQKTDTDGEVLNVSVNGNGWYAAAAQENGYKGAVTVYNAKKEAVYKWYSGESYLLGAALSDSNSLLAALTMSGSSSRIVCLSLDSQEPKGVFSSGEDTFFDIGCIGNSGICAVSKSSLVFLNSEGKKVGSYDYSDGYLKNYSFDGSGFAALAIGRYQSGDSAQLVTLDPGGQVIAALTVAGEVNAMSVCGKYIAVLYPDSLVLYDKALKQYAAISDVTGVRDILMRSDGSVIMVTGSGAVIYTP